MSKTTFHKSACILCSINCGIEIEADIANREIIKIKGDKDHPLSQGYICQKATRLNYYQSQTRLTSPLRKKVDGTFEEISWDIAIKEIAKKLVDIRDTHGGTSIAYAGGGGQGNHLGGIYAQAFRAACGTPYLYSSIAQEKTGNFWVHGRLFGRQNTNYAEPIEDAEFALIIGANPMQSHGMQRARKVIGEISRDKNRTLVVIDPRETETAKKADHFLQVKPGKDAWLMSAMLGIIIQEGLEDQAFIAEHTTGFEELKSYFMEIPVQAYSEIAGISFEKLQAITRAMATAKTVVIRSDLGIEMSHNSTLNAYLKRLLFLVTGNFGKHGTNHLTTWFFPLLGHSKDGGIKTQVTGMQSIAKLYPPNILPLEIDSDHPKRVRALFVDSANPMVNWADIPAQRKAYPKLDLMVVVDVAMTETAREAHYVLPAANQFEKAEAAAFTENFFYLRQPVLPPLEATLSEPEIYSRLIKAMGELPKDLSELKEAARQDRANQGQGIFQSAFMMATMKDSRVKTYGSIVLKETLGKALPKGSENGAILWFAAQLYAMKYPKAILQTGIEGDAKTLGDNLFNKILNSPSGVVVSHHNIKDHWSLMKTPDKKVHLFIPELCDWLEKLPERLAEQNAMEKVFPYNLIAGERRTYNANAVIRHPEWRKTDKAGFLKINPADAAKHDIEEGDTVELSNAVGSIQILATLEDEVPEGVISMPHGHGLNYGKNRSFKEVGALANLLTSTDYCDPLAKTPYHKQVRVRMEKVVEAVV